jgi:hypothetical protein
VALILLLVLVLAFPAGAAASQNQETILQDDPKIVFAPSGRALDHTLGTLESLGVDRIRVSAIWDLFGPDSKSKEPPIFEQGPGDPGSYNGAAWERYDRIVRLAAKHSIGVLLNPTTPAPAWAAGLKKGGVFPHYVKNPDPGAFRDFVEALGHRYDGTWPDPKRGNRDLALPAVDHWSIWNEPNYPSWLGPQWQGRGRDRVPSSPHVYRRLVDAAYSGLKASGHENDTILLGETAPGGAGGKGLTPVPFVRELYCLNRHYQPYHGRPARRRGCPTSAASRGRFAADHPALFRTTGWAHHAYNLFYAPTWHHPDRSAVTIGDLPRLTSVLDRSRARWHQDEPAPDVWITEYGYQTRPPDPYARVSPRRAARFLNQGDFMMSLNERVASVAQFLLYDDLPRAHYRRKPRKQRLYWGTWQSGLITSRGRHKPSYDAYRLPLWVSRSSGRQLRVWAQYRPGAPGAALSARIEFRGRGASEWSELGEEAVLGDQGMLDTRVQIPRAGTLRVVWADPAKEDPQASPPVAVRPGR